MKSVLIVTPGEEKPRQFELKGKRIGLGRGEENDIHLELDAISLNHLEFRKTDDGFEIVDLGSTNGTRVNGKKTEKSTLQDGDRILIGETVPAHFLVLAEGETWQAATDPGTEEDRKVAGEFVSMSDRLDKLEANIEEKQGEAAKLEEQLAELRDNYSKQLTEYAEAQLALDQLQKDIAEKRQQGAATPEELKQLEDSLLEKTQRVQLMSTDLAAQQQQISQLEKEGPVAPPASPVAPALPTPKPAPPDSPATAPPAGQPAPAPAPASASAGQKTVKLIKRPGAKPGTPAAPAPTIVKRKRP